MGHHGWQGDPPRTEALARERIIAAAERCLTRNTLARTTLSEIAGECGVTRQTVYRYFSNLGELLYAVAEVGAVDFVARMRDHLKPCSTPLEVVVESIVFCLEELPHEPRIGILFQAEDGDLFGRGITSSTGFELGTRFLQKLPVAWPAHGVAEEDLAELAELMLRLIGSFMQHPPTVPRSPDDVRRFLRRWLGPALVATPL